MYIDPGSGALLWQLAFSALLGVGYTVRTLPGRIWRFLVSRNKTAGRE
jgi:hypothetical protein